MEAPKNCPDPKKPPETIVQTIKLWSVPAYEAYTLGKSLIDSGERVTSQYLQEHPGASVDEAKHLARVFLSEQMIPYDRATRVNVPVGPIPMRLPCPSCGKLHIDEGEFATKAHHTHACQFCGMVWRPALVDTVGVQFLPGFKNHEG